MVDRGIARDHFPVSIDSKTVGEVTSGSFSPSLKKSVGLAFLPVEYTQLDQLFQVDIRGNSSRPRWWRRPFTIARPELCLPFLAESPTILK